MKRGGDCFGCAASCAVQEAVKKDFKAVIGTRSRYFDLDDRAEFFKVSSSDLQEFELVVDNLRYGQSQALFIFFGISLDKILHSKLPTLTTEGWQGDLHHYERFSRTLKELGL